VGVDCGGPGDRRLALELLWRAGKYAELDGRSFIEPRYVRAAYADVVLSTGSLDLSEGEVEALSEMSALADRGLSCPLRCFDGDVVEGLRKLRLVLVGAEEVIPLADLRYE